MRPVCRTLTSLLVAGMLLVGVAACSEDPNSVAAQAKSGDRKGFVAGNGAVEKVAPERRGDALQVTGATLDGTAWTLSQEKGKVVVLNVWGSWCGPCVAEADDLQQAWSTLSTTGEPVQFMGLNFRDPSPQTAAAFVRSRKITYPSLSYDGGRALLGLRGQAPCTPTTLVVDRDARIAARVCGPVTTSTLTGLVSDILAEKT